MHLTGCHHYHLTKLFKFPIQRELMRLVLLDRFNLNKLESYPANLTIDKIESDEVCISLENAQNYGYLVNTVTDEELIMQISELCGFELMRGEERGEKLKEDDKAYVVQREGKKLTFFEIWVNTWAL